MLTKCNVQQNIQNVQISTLNHLWLLIYLNKRITGIVFPTLVVDGDNDTVESLNASDIYRKRGIDLKIQKIECLSHVMRKMTNTLFNDRVETGTFSIEEGSVEAQPNEIEYMTLSCLKNCPL